MSLRIKNTLISKELADKISNELEFIPTQKEQYAKDDEPIYPYKTVGDYLHAPFFYSTQLNFERPPRESFPRCKVTFKGTLRENQKVVANQATRLLNNQGSCMLSLYCGFGKSVVALYLSSITRFKTLIIANKIVLLKQWKDYIHKFCPEATVQILTTKDKIEDVDFYIVNAINVEKFDFFKDIGTVICDEIHCLATYCLSRSFLNVAPRYLIGLSATPYRSDGMDKLLEVYFGTEKIVAKLYRKHIVYKVKTGIKIEGEMGRNGKLNWNSVLDKQCNNLERNELIIKIALRFYERYFLILCKRVDQANYLVKRFKELEESVTSLVGLQQEYDGNARILIATVSKCGVGFNNPKLNTLLIASDMEQYFIQYLGRVFRTEDEVPVIFDIVDDFGVLVKHYLTRKEVYKEAGGVIKNFDLEDLDNT